MILMMIVTSLVCYAANGDIVGHIYSTDIRAFINGVEVPSYNIGGKTAVVLEDILQENSCVYNDEERSLEFFSLDPLQLLRIDVHGLYDDFKDAIHVPNRAPRDLVIDEENEIVTFCLVDRYNSDWYTDYQIDLKNGHITANESPDSPEITK